jgi:hypothetical protein
LQIVYNHTGTSIFPIPELIKLVLSRAFFLVRNVSDRRNSTIKHELRSQRSDAEVRRGHLSSPIEASSKPVQSF